MKTENDIMILIYIILQKLFIIFIFVFFVTNNLELKIREEKITKHGKFGIICFRVFILKEKRNVIVYSQYFDYHIL